LPFRPQPNNLDEIPDRGGQVTEDTNTSDVDVELTSIEEAAAAPPAPALVCPWCSGPVDVKSPHVHVAGSAVRVYCSDECMQALVTGAVTQSAAAPEPPVRLWPHLVGMSIGLGTLALLSGGEIRPELELPAAVAAAAEAEPTPAPAPAPSPTPEQLEREAAARMEAAWVADLSRDAWIHPLAGPTRWMPKNHTQAFGAERPGERPPECVSGHCGVDLGGGLWGEPVLAVHDGFVDRVNRGPNEEHGGVYVRIAHRNRTVFTWYFHLAAVPRWITPGTRVEAGQVIGLVGDTGVKTSAPHLHFAISVKPSKDAAERYLDPESLIAIWPLFIPGDDDGDGRPRVSTAEPPGVPMRTKNARKPRPPATAAPAAEAPAPSQAAAPSAAPAPDSLPAAPVESPAP
jgi:murein DD-endopeptidase MepM/ murein hydrolase activator NlpD